YDANGNVSSSTDFNGTVTSYSYDLSRNLETSRVEGSGTASARTITASWHPTYRIPLQVNEPLRRTLYTHDGNGNVLTRTEQATTDVNGSQGAAAVVVGSPRVWTSTYNNVGQVLSVTGPRTDVIDKTTYTYDNQGNLTSVTNAAGHVTTLSGYDPHGHVGTITDPNGLVTTLTYAPRGWLLSRITSADGITEVTSYTYDGVGQMTKVTLPDNSQISYTYDDAHRLTTITDNIGNSIHYTLDNMGNRLNETVTDSNGNLSRNITRIYDALSRLQQVTGAAQ
ncbi:RHS repeat protein, partial [Undibacterium sp. Xuan67W]